MQISIRNFRGVASADIEAGKITLIGGRNHQGKTSMAEGIAATLTGEAIPVQDVLKSAIKSIIREGAKTASCLIVEGESRSVMNWPDCLLSATGPALKPISKLAAGLESILDIDRKKRADFLAPFLNAEPTLEDIGKELKSQNIPPATIEAIKEAVKISGIQNVWKRSQETGTKLKGQWEMITGEKYGSAKIQSWYPAKYYSALGARTEAELTEKLEALHKDEAAGIAAEAVAGMQKEQLEAQAAALPALEKDFKHKTAELSEARIKTGKIRSALSALQNAPQDLACPHCGGLVKLAGGKLEACTATEEDSDQIAQRVKELNDDLIASDAGIEELSQRIFVIREGLTAGKDAAAQLAQIAAAGENVWTKNLAEVRAALQTAAEDLEAFTTKAKADTLAAALIANKLIQEVLAPGGLRETKLKKVLAPFNQKLLELSEAAAWGPIALGMDFSITQNGRPDFLCSGSERFQIKTVFQLALSGISGERLVLIDGADIIVGKERNGLIAAVQKADLPVMIFMSFTHKESLPKLEAVGGVCYWIEEGEINNG
jgi:hypothetical protein